MKQLKTKVLIIGAGPAGMSLALYLKRAKVDFLLVEKGTPGGKLNNISLIANYMGVKSISGPDLAMRMYEQLNELKIEILPINILEVIKNKNNFSLLSDEYKITSDLVVFATGVAMQDVKIKGYQRLFHKGISTCAVCDGYLYKNKRIVVVGSNDIAKKEYIYLKMLTKRIVRIDKEQEKVLEFIGKNKLEKIITNKKEYLCDAAFIYLKESLNSSLLSSLKLKLKNNRILVNNNYETSVKNVYAIGDAINKPIYQIIGAINDASILSVTIVNSLRK